MCGGEDIFGTKGLMVRKFTQFSHIVIFRSEFNRVGGYHPVRYKNLACFFIYIFFLMWCTVFSVKISASVVVSYFPY